MRAVSDWFFGILRLSVWEWFKLRRRWMPWLLLAFLVLFPQIGVVSSYFIYRGDISSSGWGQHDIEFASNFEDAQGYTVEVRYRCSEILDGGIPARVADLRPDARAKVMAEIEDYRSTVCEDESGLLESESRKFFVMPASISNGLGAAAFMGIVLTMVLAASVMGTEYSWGTLRTSLVSGVARRKYLTAKVVTLLAVAAGGLLVTALTLALTSLLFTVLVRHVGGDWTEGEWATTFIVFGKTFYGIVPYLMLAVFIAVLTSSTGMGIGIAMGYYMIEAIVTGILVSAFDWFEPVSNFILGPNVAAWLSHDDVIQVTLGIRADGDLGMSHYFLVMLAYTVALGAAAFWRFEHKDVTGAKGD